MALVQAAIDIITKADLSPTEHSLLKHFVEGASSTSNGEAALRKLKQQWRSLVSLVTVDDPIPQRARELVLQRDGRDFAMQRNPSHVPGSIVEPAHVLPPSSVRGLTENNMRPLLEAFLSGDVVATLTNLFHAPADSNTYLKNVLLLPPSIHRAFRAGHVDSRPRLDIRNSPPPHEDGPMKHCVPVSGLYLGDGTRLRSTLHFFELSTTDTEKLPLPSGFLMNVHFRFATALHLFYVEDKAASGWPPRQRGFTLPQPIISGFFSLWRLLPTRFRAFCYTLLNKLGRRLHTTILAPRLLDTWEVNGVTNILMTHLPGQYLGSVAHFLSYAERDALAAGIRSVLAQLRSIPNTTPYLIADTLGGPITDHRIPEDTGGPFSTEAEFNAHLTSHLSVSFEQIVRDNGLPYREHKHFPLTHSDFHHSNILLERGRLSGSVDWESVAFKPEYWDEFEGELAVERRL
ncbi:hypothetical protein BDW74DRAFT_168577 [Aspergillus multicolor]|uniref:uncharacterized protein n=1 Tax=Aspergillus multicolor TaxID=41759 RepID=UPI003CCCFCFD